MVHVGSGLSELETEQMEVICDFLLKINQKVDAQDDFLVFVHCLFVGLRACPGYLSTEDCNNLFHLGNAQKIAVEVSVYPVV